MEWWNKLDSSVQVAIVSAIVNIVVVIVGFIATYRASIKAAETSSRASIEQTKNQISAQNQQKLAEFRLSWIEDLRSAATSLYRDQYEFYLVKRDLASTPLTQRVARQRIKEARRELSLRISQTKNDMILRINPNTQDEDEAHLLQLLRRSVSTNRSSAISLRRDITATVNKVLRKEWKKATDDLVKKDHDAGGGHGK